MLYISRPRPPSSAENADRTRKIHQQQRSRRPSPFVAGVRNRTLPFLARSRLFTGGFETSARLRTAKGPIRPSASRAQPRRPIHRSSSTLPCLSPLPRGRTHVLPNISHSLLFFSFTIQRISTSAAASRLLTPPRASSLVARPHSFVRLPSQPTARRPSSGTPFSPVLRCSCAQLPALGHVVFHQGCPVDALAYRLSLSAPTLLACQDSRNHGGLEFKRYIYAQHPDSTTN